MRGASVIAAIAFCGCGKSPPAAPVREQLAAGTSTACRLASTGRVTCWGDGGAGTLGHGGADPDGAHPPARVVGLDDAIAISAGLTNTCAIGRGGTVACWGVHWGGPRAGTGTTNKPLAIDGISHVVQLSAGRSHICAVEASGAVWCWGSNYQRQAGHASELSLYRPTRVEGIDDAVEVSGGADHSCARHRDGHVSCWGSLEDRDVKDHRAHAIDGLRDVTALASGDGFVCGLTGAGEVWCAGQNRLGQLGAGDSDPHDRPVRVRDLIGIRAITAKDWHGCALGGGGEVWCWGSEAGHGILPSRYDDEDHGPLRVTGLGTAIDLAVGGSFACIALADSSVWCWGNGRNGETGQGSIAAPHEPRRVPLD